MNTRLVLQKALTIVTVVLTTSGCVSEYGFDPSESPRPSPGGGTSGNPTPTPGPTNPPSPTNTPAPTSTPVPVPTSTPRPTSTPVPVPTATPRPTNTPAPTATPVPVPTATPRPSNTPVPTATPVPPTATPAPTLPPNSTPTPTPRAVVDIFHPRAAGGASKIDILFCVDSSVSMGGEQAILASSFEDFIVKFTQSGIDAHIGVITTDMTSNTNNYWSNTYPGYRSPGLGRLMSKQNASRWVNSSSASAVRDFQDNAMPGTNGSGRERCMSSVLEATNSAMLATGGFNAGFFRSGAMPYIIFVSDENEHHLNNDIAGLITAFKARVDSLCVRSDGCNGAQVDMVLDLSARMPTGGVSYPLPSNQTNSYPHAYLQAAQVLGSRKLNITAADWGDKLAEVGTAVVDQLEKMFKLTHPANLGSIEVRVNGVLLAANQWIYHPATQSVELANPSIAAGKELKISYTTN